MNHARVPAGNPPPLTDSPDSRSRRTDTKTKIEAMSNRATKRQAKALAQDATTDMKSGEYQNCVDKLQQIKTLTH